MNRALLACLLALCCSSAALPADNWPNWRGPTDNGISTETKLAVEWSDNKNIAWKLPLPGRGGSTPAIWGDKIFLTCAEGKNVVLLCIGTDGKVQWKRSVGDGGRVKMQKVEEADFASASPSTDGKSVFAFNGSGDFVAFDYAGKELWRFDALDRYGKFSTFHGLHTTPLLHGDRLYMQLLHKLGHWVIALDKATGKEVWKAHRETDAKGENVDAYTSPYVWSNDKQTCLVVNGNDYVTGHDMKDGVELWRLMSNPKRLNANRLIPTPVATPELLVVFTTRENGAVYVLKPGAKGNLDQTSPFVQWHSAKGASDVPSPLIHDGLLYVAGETGFLSCVELATGKEVYRERLHSMRYRASPVFADGHLYVTGRDQGYVTVVKAGRKFQKVADNLLDDLFTASPAISGGRIYMHGFKHLWAIQAGGK